MSTIYDWSLNESLNGNSDNIINWQEGQPASTVNNSARAMMTRIKQFVNDITGVPLLGGTANALSVTSSSQFTSYIDSATLVVRAQLANAADATLNLNNLGAKSIWKDTAYGLTHLTGGEMHAGGIYELIYRSELEDSDGAFFLINPTSSLEVPVGSLMAFAAPGLVPVTHLYCNGAAVSREDYDRLFDAIGTIFGKGDGATTFNLPDFRGIFVRGFDDGRGIDPNRTFGEQQEHAFFHHDHPGSILSDNGAHDHEYVTVNPGLLYYIASSHGTSLYEARNTKMERTLGAGLHTHYLTIASEGGPETRPINNTVFYGIKT